MQPDSPEIDFITKTELDSLPGLLDLSPAQTQQITAVIQAREHALHALREKLKAGREEFHARLKMLGPDEVLEYGSPLAHELAAMRETEYRLIDQLNADNESTLAQIANFLNDYQHPLWNRFLMDRRRHRWLGKDSAIVPDMVDVISIVESLDVDVQLQPTIAPVLDQYSTTLDALLIQRHDAYLEFYRQWRKCVPATLRGQATEFDPVPPPDENLPPQQARRAREEYNRAVADKQEQDVRRQEPQMAPIRQIRLLNHSTIDALAAVLPPEVGHKLVRAYHVKAYPFIYATSPLEKWIDRVLALNDLSPRQADAIKNAVQTVYRPQRDQEDLALRKIWDRQSDDWRNAVRGHPDPTIRQQTADAIALRNATEKQLFDLVWPMLTQAQQDQLGKPQIPYWH